MNLLIDLHYLPSLEYFCALQPYKHIQLEMHEHYVKQSYRNRCFINTAHGVEMLVVPLTAKHGKVPIKDVRIEYVQKWQNNQWRTIESAYRKAPFFEYYAEALNKILYTKHTFLFDLNSEMLSFCLTSLRMAPVVSASVAYEKECHKKFLDLRSHIQAKKSYSERAIYTPHNYYQVFGNAFVENLSLIDLLFCEGPRAGSVILASQKKD